MAGGHRSLSKGAKTRLGNLVFDAQHPHVNEQKALRTAGLIDGADRGRIDVGIGRDWEPYLYRDKAGGGAGKDNPAALLKEVNESRRKAAKNSEGYVDMTMPELEAIAAAKYGGTPQEAMAQLIAAGVRNHEATSPGIQLAKHGAARALYGAGQELKTGQISPEMAELLGIDQDALAKVYGSEAKPPSKGDGSGVPEWLPHMANIPPMQTGLAYGALGAGAAALLTANLLASQGQQQVNNDAYAQMVQAANAY